MNSFRKFVYKNSDSGVLFRGVGSFFYGSFTYDKTYEFASCYFGGYVYDDKNTRRFLTNKECEYFIPLEEYREEKINSILSE